MLFHLLVHSPNALSKQDWVKPKLGTRKSGPKYLSHHSLFPRIHSNNKLDWDKGQVKNPHIPTEEMISVWVSHVTVLPTVSQSPPHA